MFREPAADSFHKLCGQRYLRNQEKDAATQTEGLFHGIQVDLGLSASRYAVEKTYGKTALGEFFPYFPNGFNLFPVENRPFGPATTLRGPPIPTKRFFFRYPDASLLLECIQDGRTVITLTFQTGKSCFTAVPDGIKERLLPGRKLHSIGERDNAGNPFFRFTADSGMHDPLFDNDETPFLKRPQSACQGFVRQETAGFFPGDSAGRPAEEIEQKRFLF